MVDTGDLRSEKRRTFITQATYVDEVGVSLPRRISGKVILVISGPGRVMPQSLAPSRRNIPQEVSASEPV